MNFNGIDMTSILKVNKITGRGLAEWEVSTLSVSNRDGLYYKKGAKRRKERIINVDFTIMASNMAELRRKIDELNAILDVDEAKPLIFPDEPNKTYYAIPEISSNGEDGIDYINQSTIKFVCPDPYKYGPEIQIQVPSDVFTITNNGTAETSPTFELKVLKPVTLAMIQNQDNEYIMLGKPAPIDTPTFVRQELVLHDTCDTVTGWTSATYVDNGYIAGDIISNGGAFVVDKVGSAIEPYNWQGPAIKRSIGTTLKNFKMEVLVDLLNVGTNVTGMIEIYLLDSSNRTVMKIGIEDVWPAINQVQGKMQLGELNANRYHYYRTPDYSWGWNNYSGVLRLERDGHKIRPYFALIDSSGREDWVASSFIYYDYENKYQTPITQIQVAMRIWPATERATMRVKDIKFWRYNEPISNEIPYIAAPGDVITFDHKTKDILINGEDRMDLKDFGANFFKLKKGENKLIVYPDNAFRTTVEYRERYL